MTALSHSGGRRAADRPHGSGLDHGAFKWLSGALIALVLTGAAYGAVRGMWYGAAALLVFAVLGLLFRAAQDRLPSVFTLLFLLAGLINTCGYTFDLWIWPLWFDEAVHAFTSFTISAALGWILLSRPLLLARRSRLRFTAAVTMLGLLLGVAWEVFEWIIGIIDGPVDTIMDLIMDAIGAIAAGLFCLAFGRKRQLS